MTSCENGCNGCEACIDYEGSQAEQSQIAGLKPCPCCASSAQFVQILEGENIGGHCITCTSSLCGLTTNLMFSMMEDCRPILAERWNHRVAPAADPEQRTRLREHMGQVLSASLAGMCDDDAMPDWCDSRHIDELLDELMPVIRVHFDSDLSDPSWSAMFSEV